MRVNATGPPGHDARKYGWVRKMHSGFGFVRLNAKSRKELQIQFVQAIRCPPPPPPPARAPSLDLKAPSIVRTADVRTKVGR
jgi:hypothetical protein